MDDTTPRRGRSSNTYNAFDIKPTEIDPGDIVFEGAVEPPVLVVTRDLTDACPELTAYQGHPCFYTGTYSRAHAALVFVDASGTFTQVGIERTAALAHAQKLPLPLHNTQSARIIDELTKTAVGDVQVGDLLGFYGIVDRSAARGKPSPLLPGGQTPRKSGRKKTPTRTYDEVAAAKALAAATAGGTASHSVPERLRRALRALRAHKKSDYDSSDSDDEVFTMIPYGQQMRTAYDLARLTWFCMRKWECFSLAASKAKADRAYLISNFLAVSSESEESDDDEEDTAKALKTFLQSVNLGRFEKGLAKLGVTSIEAFKNLDSAKALAWAKSSQIKPKATAGEIGLLVRYCQGKQLKKASKTREALGGSSSSTDEPAGSSLSSLNTIIPGMGKTPKPTKLAAKLAANPPPPTKQSRLPPPAAATAPKTTKDDTESLRTTPLVRAMVANIPNGMKAEAAVVFIKHLLPSLCAAVPAVAELKLDDSVVSLEVAIESMLMTKTKIDGHKVAILMMRPAKNGRHVRGKTVPVILRSGTILDPVKSLWDLVQGDPVPESEKATTPLFRTRLGGSAAPLRVPQVRAVIRALMSSIGLDPRLYGAHSLRIGGATAALAAGIHPAQIRLLGRWNSDLWEIYTRATLELASSVATAIGSTPFHDIESGFHTERLETLQEEAAVAPEFGADDEDGMSSDED